MLTESIRQQTELKLAVRGRNEAGLLLERLVRDRRSSEMRLAAAGKHDPMKRLTGESALDRAVESTRALLETVDALVDDLRDVSAGIVATNGHPGSNGTTLGTTLGTTNGTIVAGTNGTHPAHSCEIVVTVGPPQIKAGAAP